VNRSQHAADAARRRVIGDWAISDAEMRFLIKSEPIHLEQDVFDPRGWAALQRRLDEWLEERKDFRPAFAERLSEGAVGMLVAKYRDVSIVVNLVEIGPPT
jgi:hypothetical protein